MVCNESYVHGILRKEILLKKWPLNLKQLTTDQTVNSQATNKLPTAVVLCRTRPVSQNLTRPIQTEQRLCRGGVHWRTRNDCSDACSTKLLSCNPWRHQDFDNNEVFGLIFYKRNSGNIHIKVQNSHKSWVICFGITENTVPHFKHKESILFRHREIDISCINNLIWHKD